MKRKVISVLATALLCSTTLFSSCSPCFAADVPAPPNGSSQWKLVFDDEFNGTSLDTSKWDYNYPWGNTHNHRAYCAPENVSVSDGLLKIKAENKRHPKAPATAKSGNTTYSLDYTSGAVNTKGKFEMTAGYIEGRFKMPSTKGFWPAFWTLNSDGSWPPEIDIFEILCHAPNELHTNYHYGPSWDKERSYYQKNTVADLSKDFHTYAVEWAPDYMKWYLDGRQIGTTFKDSKSIAQSENMYIIINMAIGGWESNPDSTTIWPSNLECDWVRVWQKNSGTNDPNSNNGFEEGSLSPWTKWNDAAVVDNNSRTGRYCLRVGNGPASAEKVIKVEPKTTYTLTGYGKTPSGQSALIGVKNYGGQQIITSIASTDYSQGSVTFTTESTNTNATIFFYHEKGSGYCYGDDFEVKKSTVSPIKPGDINGDKRVDVFDATLLKAVILKKKNESAIDKVAADIDKDGNITALDYLLLKKLIQGR